MQLTKTLVTEPLQRSEPRTFCELVEQYQRPLYALAYDLTGNHHDAEDLSQEVFIKAYRGVSGFRGEAQLYSWLYRIAVNTYLNKRRKKALRFRQLWDDFSQAPRDHAPQRGPEEHLEADAIRQHVDAALKTLSPRERSAFVLRHYQNLSLKEVAAVMEVAEGTVKSLLFRAMQKLRTSLAFYREDLGLPS
ncbi:MAG: RNA polymerase sigma factor [Rhodothermales bacterium]